MITLKQLIAGRDTIPVMTSWYLADISEAKGRQELYKKQLPQRLKSLKEHGLRNLFGASVWPGRYLFLIDRRGDGDKHSCFQR